MTRTKADNGTADAPTSWAFCEGRNIQIAPGLELQSIPGRGTGVFATSPLKKGHRLMHVPTTALLTTARIPDDFVSVKTRKKVPVHALLAAYLTFGVSTDDQEKFGSWMKTWPKLEDFITSLPMLWPEGCLLRRTTESATVGVSQEASISFEILPPPLTGSWIVGSPAAESARGGSTSRADLQKAKLQSHIKAIMKFLPQYAACLSKQKHPDYWRFIHSWCCVNTRCFYYVAPGQRAPADPNEAMAMCPGMDMFNHTDAKACKTKFDRTGYFAIADRDYDQGEEVLLSYGAHRNDVLWAEYGFLLEKNISDSLRIDKMVLENLTARKTELLQEYGYAGEYWLRNDGVCWRTEVVAWLTVLTEQEWIKMVQEGWDPVEIEPANSQVKRKQGGVTRMVQRERRATMQKQIIVTWLMTAMEEVESSLRGLSGLSRQQVLEILAATAAHLRVQGVGELDVDTVLETRANQRLQACLKRWGQIWEMLMNALRLIEKEAPGSFVTMEPGRSTADLTRRLEEIIHRRDGL
jgi:hypothetical protein